MLRKNEKYEEQEEQSSQPLTQTAETSDSSSFNIADFLSDEGLSTYCDEQKKATAPPAASQPILLPSTLPPAFIPSMSPSVIASSLAQNEGKRKRVAHAFVSTKRLTSERVITTTTYGFPTITSENMGNVSQPQTTVTPNLPSGKKLRDPSLFVFSHSGGDLPDDANISGKKYLYIEQDGIIIPVVSREHYYKRSYYYLENFQEVTLPESELMKKMKFSDGHLRIDNQIVIPSSAYVISDTGEYVSYDTPGLDIERKCLNNRAVSQLFIYLRMQRLSDTQAGILKKSSEMGLTQFAAKQNKSHLTPSTKNQASSSLQRQHK